MSAFWCSWLRKLQLVKDVLVDRTSGAPDLDTLANAYIYLQVLAALCPLSMQQHTVLLPLALHANPSPVTNRTLAREN